MSDLTAVINRALALLGLPYRLGGRRADPTLASGLDCSELTAYAYEAAGIKLPWNAQQQYNSTERVQSPQPGDLVFFSGTVLPAESNGDTITHVGLYLGAGRMVNAEDDGVQIADLSQPYWQQHLAGYGRVIPDAPAAPAVDLPAGTIPSAAPAAPPPTGSVGSGVSAVDGGVLSALWPAGVVQSIAGLYDRLVSRDTWIRLALVAVGGALVIGGGIIAVMSTDAGQAAASTAAHAAGTAAKTAVLV